MIDPLPLGEAIVLARQFFQHGHRTWARPLIYTLEQSQPQLALRWAIRLFNELLAVRGKADSLTHQQRWLDELTALIDRNDVAKQCDNCANEAWRKDSRVNVLDRGIARLYWALMNYIQRRLDDYIFQVTSAVGMLADNEEFADKMDEPTLEHAIALCQRMIGHPSQPENRKTEDGEKTI